MASKDRLKIDARTLAELETIVDRTKAALSPSEHQTLRSAVETLAFLTSEIESKGVSIRRLRKMLFGSGTEKTDQVLGDSTCGSSTPQTAEPGDASSEDDSAKKSKKKKRKGHGRNGANAYRGAKKVRLTHETLEPKDPCPECKKGKVYRQKRPALLVRITGMAPLCATVYERERLRCNLCGRVFKAREPTGVGSSKYDETAAAMIALLKYGCGLPFNRLERLQRDLGIPLPKSRTG